MTDSSDPNNIYAPPQSNAAPAAADPDLPPPSTNLRPLCIVMGILMCLGSLGCLCGGGFYGGAIMSIQTMAENMLEIDDPATLDIIDQLNPVAVKAGLTLVIMTITITVVGMWLGIGSMMCRRWAQKLLLAMGWTWAAFQVMSFISTIITIPAALKFNQAIQGIATPGAGAAPMGASGVADVIQQIITQIGSLVPPVILIIVYGLRNVKLTCWHADTKTRWTDDVPTPALAVWIAFIWGLLFFIGGAPITHNLGFAFGTILTGPTAIAFFALQIVICVVAAFLIAKRNIVGWVIAVVSIPTFYISGALAMKNWDTVEFIRAFGVPSNLVDDLVKTAPAEIWPAINDLMTAQWMAMAFYAVAILIFLIAFRRSFVKPA